MAEEITYTKDEIVEGLKNNPSMALNFALDNNLDGIIAALKAEGFSPDDDEQAMSNLKFLIEFDKPKFDRVLDSVPYNNVPNNWTEGLDDLFRPEVEDGRNTPTTKSFSWGSLLSGIGVFLTGMGGSMLNPDGTTMTAAQVEAARVAAEAERKRRDRNMLIIILVLVAAAIGIAIYVNSKKKG